MISMIKSKVLNTSKMIMRPERVTQECLDPSLQSSTRFSPLYHYPASLAWKHLGWCQEGADRQDQVEGA